MNATAILVVLGYCATAVADEATKKAKPRFTINKETTFVTGPVDKNGYIDFAAALNERLGKGVTPENNANVLIWKALGPKPWGKSVPEGYFKLMEMEEPPEKGDYFVELGSFLKEDPTVDPAERRNVEELLEPAFKGPWRRNDYPQVAAWLKANEKPLGLIIEAAKRSHYFSLTLSSGSESGLSGLAGWTSPALLKNRSLARALIGRAMLRIGEGQLNEAWQDLLAVHRLARLVGRGGTTIESLVGIAIDVIVSQAELVFLDRGKLDAKKIEKYLSDLQTLLARPNIADNADVAERFIAIDIAMTACRKGIPHIEMILVLSELKFDEFIARTKAKDKPDPEIISLLDDIDWDPILRDCNQWCDRLVAALRESDRDKRNSQLQALEEERQKAKKDLPKSDELVKAFQLIKDDPAAKSNLLRRLFASDDEWTGTIPQASDRAEQIQRNLQVAFALAAYQREHGSYPKALDVLAPKYLAKVPNDYFTGKPLIYRPNEKGYLLYSFGPNGKDDEGRTREDDPQWDDISVRIPVAIPAKK